MDYSLRICGVEPESIVDGEGIRYVVFAQGCPHYCIGCHNPQSQPFGAGRVVSLESLFKDISENPLLKGITLSGGEPFSQPGPLAELARMAHGIGLDVVTYTGYVYERLLAMKKDDVNNLLAQTDTLIDGPFVIGQRDLTLRFRGSRNQRIINMNQTRIRGKATLAPTPDRNAPV